VLEVLNGAGTTRCSITGLGGITTLGAVDFGGSVTLSAFTGGILYASGAGLVSSSSTSATLRANMTDEKGSGALIFDSPNSMTLIAPILGTPSSGNLSNCTALPLTTGVTGVLPTANGGTNKSSAYAVGDVVYASGTTTLAGLAAVATGQVLTSAGTGTAPAWSGDPTATSFGMLTNNSGGFKGKPTSGTNDYSLLLNASNQWELRGNVGGVFNTTFKFVPRASGANGYFTGSTKNNDLGTADNNSWANLHLAGATSGYATIAPPAVAGSAVLTLPGATGTLATLAGTETFTNKTLTSPTLTTPALGTPSSGTLTSCTGLPIDSGTTGTASHYMFLATGNQAGPYDTALFSIFPSASDAVSVSASSTYYFKAVIRASKTNGTNAHELRFALTETGSALTEAWWTAVGAVGSTVEVNSGSSSAAAKCSPNTSGTNSETYYIVIDGYFLTAAGTTAVTPQVKWSANPGDGATTGQMSVNVGTHFEMRRAGGVTETQGTWN